MIDSKNIIFDLKKELLATENKIQEHLIFQSNNKMEIENNLNKHIKMIGLLKKGIAKRENELKQTEEDIKDKKEKLYKQFSGPYQNKMKNLKSNEEELKKQLEQNHQNLKNIKFQNDKSKESEQVIKLNKSAEEFKSKRNQMKDILDKEINTLKQLENNLKKVNEHASKIKEEYNSGSLENYLDLINTANKIASGYYEGGPIIQSMKFYNNILNANDELNTGNNLNKDYIENLILKLKKYNVEYISKFSVCEDEIINLKLTNQELKNDFQQQDSDLATEVSKNKMNSGEFVGGGEFFVSFSDVMSVLLCFFVVFFSISENDEEKFDKFFSTWPQHKKVKLVIKRPNNASLDPNELTIIPKVKMLVEDGVNPEAITRNDVNIVEHYFIFEDLFIRGKSKLSSNGIKLLKKRLKKTLQIGGVKQIRVEGYSGKKTRKRQSQNGRYQENLNFSASHAAVVGNFIGQYFEYPDNFLIVTGYGEYTYTKKNPLKLRGSADGVLLIKMLIDKSIKRELDSSAK